ncbi:MAG: CHAD domain-containing protein [Deltaproteobacteria bacterium]|nr:CHAD domain-containing protein [Deltaproteobacteria bacterium]
MAFAFAAGEHVDIGARRLAREGADRVLLALEGAPDGANGAGASDGDAARDEEGGDERAVHDARRTLKRLRALVRLLRGAIGDARREANGLLGDAARGLSGARDAAVMLRTFDSLIDDRDHRDGDRDRDATKVRASLRRARTLASRRAADRGAVTAKVRAFRDSVEGWTFTDRGFDALEEGVRRTYGDGRKALVEAHAAGETEVLHALRKRTKDLQYQLALLREAWPAVIGGYHDALTELGELLGTDHDLALLAETLGRRGAIPRRWSARIEERRLAIRTKVFPLAERVWVDSPSAWTRRLSAWWAVA